MGRPSKKTKAVVDEICSRLSEGESLSRICEDGHLPHKRTVLGWALNDEEFFHQYAHARDIQAETWADEMVRLSDEAKDVQKARLQIDTRKWVISKILPKKYGDKLDVTTDGERLPQAVVILPDNGRPERNRGDE